MIEMHKPIKGWSKSHGLWWKDGACLTPLLYFRKPKHVADSDFERLIEAITVVVDRGVYERPITEGVLE